MLNHAQLVAVVQAICARAKPGVALWTLEGPTPLALKWRTRSPLSSGERVLFQLAWAVWNSSSSKATVGDLLRSLDKGSLAFVASLLVAIADGNAVAIDAWLAAQGPEQQVQEAPKRAADAWAGVVNARAELGKLLDGVPAGAPRYWQLERLREQLAGIASHVATLQNELADEANGSGSAGGARHG